MEQDRTAITPGRRAGSRAKPLRLRRTIANAAKKEAWKMKKRPKALSEVVSRVFNPASVCVGFGLKPSRINPHAEVRFLSHAAAAAAWLAT
jgi:hypothetical protein